MKVALLWCVLLCVLHRVRSELTHVRPDAYLDENDECYREGQFVWRCKKDRECPGLKTLLQSGDRPRTCSWMDGHIHVICCPPEDSVLNKDQTSPSISERKCLEYESSLCENNLYVGLTTTTTTTTTTTQRPKNPDEEGEQVFHTTVFGGERALPKEHPHMALIGFGDVDRINWQCGGSLISERFVLSAAHCSDTPYGPARWARLGDLDLSSGEDDAQPQQFEIVERTPHPGYRAPAFYNDIVLFRLDRPAVFTRYVGPACLHSGLGDPPGFGVATGWGKNETNGPKSSSLLKVSLDFIPVEECKQKVGTLKENLPQGLDTKTMLCAGQPGKDTCQGDSGGPLVLGDRGGSCLPRQVGVTSFGPKNCGISQLTGTYVRVAHFVPWIESIVWPKTNDKLALNNNKGNKRKCKRSAISIKK